tara:strand:- start:378 stop:830 length:453 start_codon:yes stop_codon:yes gene_type:complete
LAAIANTCPREDKPYQDPNYEYSIGQEKYFLNYKNQGFKECNYLKNKEYLYKYHGDNRDNSISLDKGLYKCGHLNITYEGIMNKEGIVIMATDYQEYLGGKRYCIISDPNKGNGYWQYSRDIKYSIPNTSVKWILRVSKKVSFKKIEFSF